MRRLLLSLCAALLATSAFAFCGLHDYDGKSGKKKFFPKVKG